MNPRVVRVIANDDYTLTLTFANGEVGQFDVRPYLDKGIFRELQDKSYFKQARVALALCNGRTNRIFARTRFTKKGARLPLLLTDDS